MRLNLKKKQKVKIKDEKIRLKKKKSPATNKISGWNTLDFIFDILDLIGEILESIFD